MTTASVADFDHLHTYVDTAPEPDVRCAVCLQASATLACSECDHRACAGCADSTYPPIHRGPPIGDSNPSASVTTGRQMECKLTAHQVREIAVAATVDPRTVRRYVEGERLYPMTALRIRGALHKLGFEDPQTARPARAAGGR